MLDYSVLDTATLIRDGILHKVSTYDECVEFWRTHDEGKPQLTCKDGTPPICLIATQPPRKHVCEQLLRCLYAQTMRPRVLLIGDGYANSASMPKGPEGLVIRALAFPVRQGAGNRWRQIEQLDLDPEAIIVNIDDDMIASPDCIKSNVGALEAEPRKTAICWCGWRDQFSWHNLAYPQRGRVRLWCSCVSALRAGDLQGVSDFHDADMLLGIPGDDELLVTNMLRSRGYEFWRPAGHCQGFSGPSQHDEIAQHMNPRPRELDVVRTRVYAEIGVPFKFEQLVSKITGNPEGT